MAVPIYRLTSPTPTPREFGFQFHLYPTRTDIAFKRKEINVNKAPSRANDERNPRNASASRTGTLSIAFIAIVHTACSET